MNKKQILQEKITEKIFKNDEFITKIRYANAGALNMGNVLCFDYAFSRLPSEAPIIEIGSLCGLSANVITYLKFKHKIKNELFCVDPWDYYDGDRDKKIGQHPTLTNGEYTKIILQKFKDNLLLFSSYDLPFPIQSIADDFFVKWENKATVTDIFAREKTLGGAISFAYIDGNHDYDYAMQDFLNVDRFLDVGGFILFDDSADNTGWGSCDVAQEVCKNDRYQLIKKSPHYFFQKVK